jgi:NAD(P)-dependent dehydrogenase (short-subunit alcohol dehydrogenase family)
MSNDSNMKVVLVAGGASGFGRANACQLASEGASVVVADVDDANGHEVVDEIRAGGGAASLVVGDISTAPGAEGCCTCCSQ